MPFAEHPICIPPQDPNAKIWRYMSLAKFISILDRGALYFVRSDKLCDSDPFEGRYTNMNVQFEKLAYEDLPPDCKSEVKDVGTWDLIKM